MSEYRFTPQERAYHRYQRRHYCGFKGARPHYSGECIIYAVDVDKLTRMMRADGRSRKRFEADAGLSKCATIRVQQRGRAHMLTLEAIASALGVHSMELVADEASA